MAQNEQSYLWDKTGEPDPELVDWERRLSRFSPSLESARRLWAPARAKGKSVRMPWLRWMAAAVLVLVLTFAILRIAWQPGRDWIVTAVSGVPLLNDAPVRAKS